MHVILGLLGSIVTILWLLHRLAEMGIGLGGLNPFLWQRRRRWTEKFEANPVYAIESPMELTALLMVAVAKADGDMSSEEKREILLLFEGEFQLSPRDAAGLLVSSSHILGKGDEVRDNLEGVIAPSLDTFSEAQATSAIDLVERIATVGQVESSLRNDLVEGVRTILGRVGVEPGKWQ